MYLLKSVSLPILNLDLYKFKIYYNPACPAVCSVKPSKSPGVFIFFHFTVTEASELLGSLKALEMVSALSM